MKIVQSNKFTVLGYCDPLGYVIVPNGNFKQDEVSFVVEAKLHTPQGTWEYISPKTSDRFKHWASLNEVCDEILNLRNANVG